MADNTAYMSMPDATGVIPPGGGGVIPPEGAESLLLDGAEAGREVDGGDTNWVAPGAVQNEPSLEEQTKGEQQSGQQVNSTPSDTN